MKINKTIQNLQRNIEKAKSGIDTTTSKLHDAKNKEAIAGNTVLGKEKALETATANLEKIKAKKAALDNEIRDLRAQAAKAIATDVKPQERNALRAFGSFAKKLMGMKVEQAPVTVADIRADLDAVDTKRALLEKAESLTKKASSYKGIFKSYANTINSLTKDIDTAKSDAARHGKTVANHMAALGDLNKTLSRNESALKGAQTLQSAGNHIGRKMTEVMDATTNAASDVAMDVRIAGKMTMDSLFGFAKSMLTSASEHLLDMAIGTENLANAISTPSTADEPSLLAPQEKLSAKAEAGIEAMMQEAKNFGVLVPKSAAKTYVAPRAFKSKLTALDVQADGLRRDAQNIVSKIKSGALTMNVGTEQLFDLSTQANKLSGESGKLFAEQSFARRDAIVPKDAERMNLPLGSKLQTSVKRMLVEANTTNKAKVATFSGEALVVKPGDDLADIVAEYDQWMNNRNSGLSARHVRSEIDQMAMDLMQVH